MKSFPTSVYESCELRLCKVFTQRTEGISPEILTGLRLVDSVIQQTFVKNLLCAKYCFMWSGYINEYNKDVSSSVA